MSNQQNIGELLITTKCNDEGVLYFGNWDNVKQGPHEFKSSHSQYSACEFSFRGPIVRWIGSTGVNQGYADIYIDSEFQQTVDSYSAAAKKGMIKFEKSGLSKDRIHTLRIVVKKDRHNDAFDCLQEIEGFQSLMPVNYPKEIAAIKDAEYVHIKSGTKPYLKAEEWSPVANMASIPEKGVSLKPGLVRDIFDRNISYLKTCFSLPCYCRESDTWNPEGGPGWSKWLPASNEGRLLAGAGNTLRWEEIAEMRVIVNKIVEDISKRIREDGYYNYYDESESYAQNSDIKSERKNYDRVFWTRGLLAAGKAGVPEAYELLRRMFDWFNTSPYLPDLLEGSNATNGLPGGPLMYLSPAGKDDDLIVTERFYDQEYWRNELKNKEPLCLCYYPGERPHCYDLLGLEAFLDEYRATGARKYIDAVIGGWEIYRGSYKHIGGATAICEADGPYPPKSYYITTGHNGETCGSVFWININSKLLELFPGEEKYAAEIEEAIFNVIAASQDCSGNIRYHNRLHGTKENAQCSNTCCEVSTAGLIGRLPEFIYSLGENGIYVNQFISSAITWKQENADVSLTLETEFPYGQKVTFDIEVSEARSFGIRIRIPYWASEDITVTINGSPSASGKPSSYICLDRTWIGGEKISFELPIGFTVKKYTGLDQAKCNYDRFALLYGPVLMALQGDLNGPDGVPHIAVGTSNLPELLAPIAGSFMEYSIEGYPEYKYVPYWKINTETFTCFPIIQP